MKKSRHEEIAAMVEEHRPLVERVAAHLAGRLPDVVDVEDLVADGLAGLADAAGRFDPARGVRFATFAAPRIRGAMIDGLRRRDHLRRNHREKIKAGRLEEPVIYSMDAPLADPSPAGRPETLKDSLAARTPPLGEALARDEAFEFLLRGLGRQKRLIMALYYAEGLTMAEIGRALGLGESRISQLHTEAICSLRKWLRRRKCKDGFGCKGPLGKATQGPKRDAGMVGPKGKNGGEKKCGVLGCSRPARAAGLCIRHFAMTQRGDPALSEVRAACRIRAEHVGNQTRKDSIMQAETNRPLGPQGGTTDDGTCRMAGCDKPAQTRGICGTHYAHRHKQTPVGKNVRAAMLPSKTSGRRKGAAPGTMTEPDKHGHRVPRKKTAKAAVEPLDPLSGGQTVTLGTSELAMLRIALIARRDGHLLISADTDKGIFVPRDGGAVKEVNIIQGG